jgi:hypothetical protein
MTLTNRYGEISDAARENVRKLRILKYRMLFIFLLLPALLLAAIVFDWIWELDLSGRMTRAYVIAIYGGLIALFVLIFLVAGYMIRKRMAREEEETLQGPTPIEAPRHAAPKPIPMSANRRSRN